MGTNSSIIWFCVNLGPDSKSLDWLRDFGDVLALAPLDRPDVILLQEAKYCALYGPELLLFMERRMYKAGYGRYRGFLTRSHRSTDHQVVFLNTERILPIHHWTNDDPDELVGLSGFVETIVDGDEHRTLWLKSVRLDPRDPDSQLADAKEISSAVPAGQRALIAGDFNSTTRIGSTDTRALDQFLDSGWAVTAGLDHGETTIDHCLVTPGLVVVPDSTWVDTSTLPYSSHRAFGGAVAIDDYSWQTT